MADVDALRAMKKRYRRVKRTELLPAYLFVGSCTLCSREATVFAS